MTCCHKASLQPIMKCDIRAEPSAPSAVRTYLGLKHFEDTTCVAQGLAVPARNLHGYHWFVLGGPLSICVTAEWFGGAGNRTGEASTACTRMNAKRAAGIRGARKHKTAPRHEMHSSWMAAAVGVFVWTTYCRPAPGSCGAACMDSASLPSSATHSQSVSSAQNKQDADVSSKHEHHKHIDRHRIVPVLGETSLFYSSSRRR